jgi:hypothetical protein
LHPLWLRRWQDPLDHIAASIERDLSSGRQAILSAPNASRHAFRVQAGQHVPSALHAEKCMYHSNCQRSGERNRRAESPRIAGSIDAATADTGPR